MGIFFLAACTSPAAQPNSTPTAEIERSATPTPFQPVPATNTPPAPTASASPPTPTPTPLPHPLAERVLIISVDGLHPDAISLAPMPNLQKLLTEAAYTLNAQTILPSSTLPGHASMLTGMCPSKHGVDWNEYLPELGYAAEPSLFTLAKEASLKTVMVISKEKLRQVTRPESLDFYRYVYDEDKIVAEKASYYIWNDFDLLFVHFLAVDTAGHDYGWLSSRYLATAAQADDAIGILLNALEASGQREGTLIIITADHGGEKTSHGGGSPAEMTIPWILAGSNILPLTFSRPISIIDTAATAAFALNLPIPASWDGLPAMEAFGGETQARLIYPCR